MDLLKIIESVEELLYRIALWIILAPRTLLLVIRRPQLINPYIAAQSAQVPEERFKDMMSPMLFWCLIGIVPHVMLLDYLATIPTSRVSTEPEWISFMKQPFATRLIAIAITAIAGPLAIAREVLMETKQQVDRESLRSPFSVQCYCLTPVYVLLLPTVFFTLRFSRVPAGAPTYIAAVMFMLACLWFLWAESVVLAAQLSVSRPYAILKAIKYGGVIILTFFVLEILVITIFNGFAEWK
jgi:hypothetical protein